jgi:hypothetical protein
VRHREIRGCLTASRYISLVRGRSAACNGSSREAASGPICLRAQLDQS